MKVLEKDGINYNFELYKASNGTHNMDINKDYHICSLVVNRAPGNKITAEATAIYDRGNAPVFLKMADFSEKAIISFMKQRVDPTNRMFLSERLSNIGINPEDWIQRIQFNNGTSHSDQYYVLFTGNTQNKKSVISEYTLDAVNSIASDSSTGWLPKWKISDKRGRYLWIKTPGNIVNWGGESYAEVIAYMVCKDFDINNHLQYKPCIVNYEGERVLCCESRDFSKEKEFVTIEELASLHCDVYDIYRCGKKGYETLLKIFDMNYDYVMDFQSYVEDILFLDFIIQNTDRHLRNIGVLCADEQCIELAPIFDSGSSLGLDYFIEGEFDTCRLGGTNMSARPFDGEFVEQLGYIRKTRKYKTNFEKTNKLLDYFEQEYSDKNNKHDLVNPIPMGSLQYIRSMLTANYQYYKKLWNIS